MNLPEPKSPDDLLRNEGFVIHSRPPRSEPIWVRKFTESEAWLWLNAYRSSQLAGLGK